MPFIINCIRIVMLLVLAIKRLYIFYYVSNTQCNSTCVHIRNLARLTSQYWCPVEWISNHIQTDIPQIPSAICWSISKCLKPMKIISVKTVATLKTFLQLRYQLTYSENSEFQHIQIFYNCIKLLFITPHLNVIL
jgi:hypothetical protein